MIKRFTKKPVDIEAGQYDGSDESAFELSRWARSFDPPGCLSLYRGKIVIWTLEGEMTALPGDWIIRGVAGDFYPCKPEIFTATYEEVAG